jgi:hypothetical protein
MEKKSGMRRAFFFLPQFSSDSLQINCKLLLRLVTQHRAGYESSYRPPMGPGPNNARLLPRTVTFVNFEVCLNEMECWLADGTLVRQVAKGSTGMDGVYARGDGASG